MCLARWEPPLDFCSHLPTSRLDALLCTSLRRDSHSDVDEELKSLAGTGRTAPTTSLPHSCHLCRARHSCSMVPELELVVSPGWPG